MGTFSTIVKRYLKTVDPPANDHGGLFVKEARTHLLLEENLPSLPLEEKLRYVFCTSMLSLKFLRMSDRRPKRSTIVGLEEV